MNECSVLQRLSFLSVRFNPIEALGSSGVTDSQVDGARHFTLASSSVHEKKQAFLHRHIPVPAIFLLLCSLDGVVKP
jgi:hypothetical protein